MVCTVCRTAAAAGVSDAATGVARVLGVWATTTGDMLGAACRAFIHTVWAEAGVKW